MKEIHCGTCVVTYNDITHGWYAKNANGSYVAMNTTKEMALALAEAADKAGK
jgi:hypothetical protein